MPIRYLQETSPPTPHQQSAASATQESLYTPTHLISAQDMIVYAPEVFDGLEAFDDLDAALVRIARISVFRSAFAVVPEAVSILRAKTSISGENQSCHTFIAQVYPCYHSSWLYFMLNLCDDTGAHYTQNHSYLQQCMLNHRSPSSSRSIYIKVQERKTCAGVNFSDTYATRYPNVATT